MFQRQYLQKHRYRGRHRKYLQTCTINVWRKLVHYHYSILKIVIKRTARSMFDGKQISYITSTLGVWRWDWIYNFIVQRFKFCIVQLYTRFPVWTMCQNQTSSTDYRKLTQHNRIGNSTVRSWFFINKYTNFTSAGNI